MGSSHDQFMKYPRTPHLFGSTGTADDKRLSEQDSLQLFADYGARIELIYLEPPLETILKQNRQRPQPVPENIIRRLVEKVEPPTLTEAHTMTYNAH